MKLTTQIHVEVERSERKYVLSIPLGAPYGETYDVVYEMLGKILELAHESAEKVKPTEEESSEDNKSE